jgi:hypothetical protein
MSGSISKIASAVAFPLNKNSNMLYFSVGQEPGQIDLKASYLELEVTLDNLNQGSTGATGQNVVLGHDGLMYNPSALVRTSKLSESNTGKIYQDLVFTNVVSNNLEYWSKGSNNIKADAIYSGAGYVGPDNSVVGVFDNAYKDDNAVIKCPLSCLLPGSLGDADLFPQDNDLEFRYLLEPQYNVFMRAVKAGLYDASGNATSQGYSFQNANIGVTGIQATALGTVGNFTTNQTVVIQGTQNGAPVAFNATITTITADSGGVSAGFLNFATSPIVGNNMTNVKIFSTINNNALPCQYLDTDGNNSTLTFYTATPALKDIYAGTTVQVNYTSFTSAGVATSSTLKTTLSSITGYPNITAVTLNTPLVVPAGGCITNIGIIPLYTNLDNSNWSIVNAHLVLYRRQVPITKEKQMLISNFESVNFSMVGGLNRSLYNLKARSNAYNAYVFTPNSTNLYSFADGIRTYLISVNDKPLTSIYVDTQGPAVHNDNMLRVLANSPYYQPKNLNQNRDKDIATDYQPIMFPAKIFHSIVKGQPNVQNFNEPDNDIRVELVADTANGLTTPQKTVYVFLEKYETV